MRQFLFALIFVIANHSMAIERQNKQAEYDLMRTSLVGFLMYPNENIDSSVQVKIQNFVDKVYHAREELIKPEVDFQQAYASILDSLSIDLAQILIDLENSKIDEVDLDGTLEPLYINYKKTEFEKTKKLFKRSLLEFIQVTMDIPGTVQDQFGAIRAFNEKIESHIREYNTNEGILSAHSKVDGRRHHIFVIGGISLLASLGAFSVDYFTNMQMTFYLSKASGLLGLSLIGLGTTLSRPFAVLKDSEQVQLVSEQKKLAQQIEILKSLLDQQLLNCKEFLEMK
ncbi:MAG: hypothetical protein KDD40_04570 [Bdellovibrionales bacterium]|nr:hypothetical protein [Bdellovibrionales bacterium]